MATNLSSERTCPQCHQPGLEYLGSTFKPFYIVTNNSVSSMDVEVYKCSICRHIEFAEVK